MRALLSTVSMLLVLVLALPTTTSAVQEGQRQAPASAPSDSHDIRLARARDLINAYRGDASLLDRARVDLEEILRQNPSFAPAYREFARYFIKRGHINYLRFAPGSLELAEESLKKAITIDPDYADAYVLFGHLYRLMDRPEEAKLALKKAEAIGTSLPWLHLNWADILLDEGRNDEAAQKYRTVINSKTRNKSAMTAAFEGLTRYYESIGNLDGADEIYRKKIAYEPDSAWNHGNYAEFLLCVRDNFDAAIQRARDALDRMNYGAGRYFLAAALYRKWAHFVVVEKDREGGARYFKEAQSIYPNVWQIVANTQNCPSVRIVQQALRTGLPQ